MYASKTGVCVWWCKSLLTNWTVTALQNFYTATSGTQQNAHQPGVREPGTFMYNCTEFMPSIVWPTWLSILQADTTYATHVSTDLQRAPPHTHTHTHTRLSALFPGLPRWATTRKVKRIWILLKQETVAICKSAPRARQITTPAPHHSVFTGWMPFLPPNQEHQQHKMKTKLNNDKYAKNNTKYIIQNNTDKIK